MSILSGWSVCFCNWSTPGILNRQSAIVLGSFSGAAPNEYDAGYSLESVYAFLRSRLSVPLITGLDFGHEQRTVTLPIGANATLKKYAPGDSTHFIWSSYAVIVKKVPDRLSKTLPWPLLC